MWLIKNLSDKYINDNQISVIGKSIKSLYLLKSLKLNFSR